MVPLRFTSNPLQIQADREGERSGSEVDPGRYVSNCGDSCTKNKYNIGVATGTDGLRNGGAQQLSRYEHRDNRAARIRGRTHGTPLYT